MNQLASRLRISFEPRIVVDPRLGQEARAEDAVVALLEQPVVADQVGRIVGAVGHHQHDRVAREALEPGADGEAEAARVVRAQAADLRMLGSRSRRRPRTCRRRWRRRSTRTSCSIPASSRVSIAVCAASRRSSRPRCGPASRPRASPVEPQRRGDGVLVFSDPGQDVGEDLPRPPRRSPVGAARTAASSRRCIAERRPAAPHPRRSIAHLVAGQLAAELGRLEQREADLAPAADVADEAVPAPAGRRAARRPARPGRRRGAGRAPDGRRRRSRCRSAACRSGGEGART